MGRKYHHLTSQYEHQTKYKIHDRWAHREGGPDISSPANVSVMPNGLAVPGQPDVKPKIEREGEAQMRQEDRAARMEARMRAMRAAANGRVAGPKVKVERFDDDERKEGRQLTRVSGSRSHEYVCVLILSGYGGWIG